MGVKKRRLEYLDYIRAFSTLLIVLTHYNAVFLYLPEVNHKGIIITAFVNRLYIGSWGVSFFIIISGASLMYVYGKALDLKVFYKKRFWSLYPLYWLCYILSMTYMFLRYKTLNPQGTDNWRVVLSLLGFDAYLSGIMPTWFTIGEWFMGMIIIFYLIFPIFLFCFKKSEKITWIGVIIIYILAMKYSDAMLFYPSQNLLVRLPEFLFGMSFVKHEGKIPKKYLFIVFGLIILDFFIPQVLHESIRTPYLGIGVFIIMVAILNKIRMPMFIKSITNWICKHSYIIFLIHHNIILQISSYFDMNTIGRLNSLILFLVCLEITCLLSGLILILYNYLRNVLKQGL